MQKKRVTMQTVAKRAGVSQTTVSLVVNNTDAGMISPETRERVLDTIRELGYRPNAAARNMRTSRSNFIGFITDQIATTPHAGLIVKGAQDVAWESGKLILLINTGENDQMEEQAIATLLEHQVEGIVYAAMYHQPIVPPRILRETKTVLLNCYDVERRLPSVVSDEVGGGYIATRTLIEAGHSRIAFANHREPTPGALGRLEGYKKALVEYGIPFDPDLVAYAQGEADGGYDCTLKLFGSSGTSAAKPTALFCFNDRMAMGAYDAFQELGLKVPHDVAVMGFDNQEMIAAQLHPGLSTVELPHYVMGRWAIDFLLRHEEAAELPPVQHVEACPLVLRRSV